MKILFQGDSVTDCQRDRNETKPNLSLGSGYVSIIAGRLTAERPDIEVYNRSVAGNRLADAYGRWMEDALNMDFDVFSCLFGVNDIGFRRRMGIGSDLSRFEFIYDRMLAEVREKKPDCHMILIAPFLFKMKDEANCCDIFNDWDLWSSDIEKECEIIEKLAKKHNARYVPMFEIFKSAQKDIAPAEHWSYDCIHPKASGHQLIADAWIEAMNDIF